MIIEANSEREIEVLQQAKWNMLRSDIYIRDKGICWICNSRVELVNYDLGHLIDKCNGGSDDYDNLAVMHKKCNISKPRHFSLEEAMKWKLTPKYLTTRPIKKESQVILHANIIPKRIHRFRKHPITSSEDKEIMSNLVVEYFNNRPELLIGEVNHDRSEAIRQLSKTLDISEVYIRRWMVNAKLVKPLKLVADGSQYRYIYEHLDELLNKYENCINTGLTGYGIQIMLYLAGKPVSSNKDKILRKITKLGLPIRQIV